MRPSCSESSYATCRDGDASQKLSLRFEIHWIISLVRSARYQTVRGTARRILLPVFEDHDREGGLIRPKRMNRLDDLVRSKPGKRRTNMRNSKFFKFLKFFLTKNLRGYIFQPNWQQGRWLHRYLLYIGRVLALGQTDFALEGVRVHHTPPSES